MVWLKELHSLPWEWWLVELEVSISSNLGVRSVPAKAAKRGGEHTWFFWDDTSLGWSVLSPFQHRCPRTPDGSLHTGVLWMDLCVSRKNFKDPEFQWSGNNLGEKGAGISKEGARKTGKHMPWDAPVFIKLSKVQSMQCIVKLRSIFCFDTIKQSREVNTVKLTVYICFLKLPVSLFALLIYIQVVPFPPSSFLSLYYYFFN